MPKKIVNDVEEEVVEEVVPVVSEVVPLTESYGRDDLNQLRDKVNEVIGKL